MTLHCEIVDLHDWTEHRAAIEELLSTCALVTPQSTTTWLTSWWHSFRADRELKVGLFWRGTQLVGYAPLMLCHERFFGIPCRVLRFVGEGISDYADLFARGDDVALLEEVVRTIVREWSWDELRLENVRGGSPTLAAFARLRSPHYFMRSEVTERCPYVDLRGRSFEEYLTSLSRKHRRDLRKDRRRLDALGAWTVDFTPALPANVLFDELRILHASRSDSKGWASVYELPGFRAQFTKLLELRSRDTEVLLSTLRLGPALISYTFGFVRGRVYYQWNVGFDHAYEDIAPNKLHHELLIQECFRRGYEEFDFMRGAHEYKFSWTDRVRENHGIRMLKRHGLRRAVNRVRWVKEREPGSFMDRCISAARALPGLLNRSHVRASDQHA